MMIEPSLRSTISGNTIWHSQWLERTFAAMILSNASSGMPDIGP